MRPTQRQEPPPTPDRPAFLLFSLGPVQEFIAAARNTRDLWRGSYLLSYLVGSALSKITLDFGPDHVLFPNLLNQPLLDLLLRDELWNHVTAASGAELWQAFGYYSKEGKRRLLTPSLPNRFLAVLPSQMAEHPEWQSALGGHADATSYAAHLEDIVRSKLACIAGIVADCLHHPDADFNRERFLEQAKRLLEIHWQVLKWPETLAEIKDLTANLPVHDAEAEPVLDAVIEMVRKMPPDHRDKRYFVGGKVGSEQNPGELKQPAIGWAALNALSSWRLDAVKTTRTFKAWAAGGWQSGTEQNKDSLNGKEETCLTVPPDERLARELSEKFAQNPHLLNAGDRLGASTLLKRFWHLSWLCEKHPFCYSDFGMPNTRSHSCARTFAG